MTITYRVIAEPETTPIKGNVSATGRDAYDRAIEKLVAERWIDGDVWAWATVTVVAADGEHEGRATLGCCSYEDEAQFRRNPDFEALCEEAVADLEKRRDSVQRIYVLSFAPSYDESSSGGCEWRRSWSQLMEEAKTLVTPGHDYRVITLDLPYHMTAEQISEFLGSPYGRELIDPPDPRQELEEALETWR